MDPTQQKLLDRAVGRAHGFPGVSWLAHEGPEERPSPLGDLEVGDLVTDSAGRTAEVWWRQDAELEDGRHRIEVALRSPESVVLLEG